MTPPAPDIQGEVTAISTAVGQLADGLASMLVRAGNAVRARARPLTEPQLRECPGCGLLQTVPALAPGMTAQCVRCPTILRRTSGHRLDHIIALTVAAFVLLVVMCSTTLMSVETAGIKRTADLFSGPEELVRQNMGELAAVIIFVTVLAPLVRLIGMLYVLIRLHESDAARAICAGSSPGPSGCARGRCSRSSCSACSSPM